MSFCALHSTIIWWNKENSHHITDTFDNEINLEFYTIEHTFIFNNNMRLNKLGQSPSHHFSPIMLLIPHIKDSGIVILLYHRDYHYIRTSDAI